MAKDSAGPSGTGSANSAEIDFLAAVAHELKTQLGIVLTTSELLAMAELPEREARYVDMLRGAAGALQALLDDLLDNTRLQSGDLLIESVPFRPHAVIEDLVNAFRPRLAEKNVDLVFHAEAAPGYDLFGDPLRIRQIVTNLLDNAAKFTDAGEIAVTVTTDCDGDGCRLVVTVADTGIGFDTKEAENIFAPFSEASRATGKAFGGTGLGLA
ncbi:MAG: hybrid sensor histidine kinase/response regulator, partial [Hyphomicrobiales bacterium]|nr:hybrid sensor histidine kinase/response regulator [Hyphomicrobiales bacterium]